LKKWLSLAFVAVVGSANAVITIGASNVAFTDISGTGTSVGAIADDSEFVISGTALSAAGFTGNALLAGGVDIRVGNNGGVLWGTSVGDTFLNADQVGAINSNTFMTMAAGNSNFGLPTGNGGLGPRQFLAVLWDDNTPATGASTVWQVIGGNLVVQWTNEDHFNATGAGVITYEMIVHGGGTSANLVDFVYQDTLYAANQYQDDGGSATIGYKNWGLSAFGNDVEFGTGGGDGATLSDPAFGGTNMQAKVSGWTASNNPNFTHSVTIAGPVPEPASMAALGLGALALIRRRRSKKA